MVCFATQRVYAEGEGSTALAHRTCSGLDANPTPLGQVPQPFLKIPFSKVLSQNSLAITNGWLMATDEAPIAGTNPHRALDFEFVNSPNHGYAYPVYASSDGCAYYTYQYLSEYEPNPATGVTTQYGVGAGLVVEIRSSNGFVTQYIHLSTVRPGIPFVGASAVGDPNDTTHPDWSPTGLFQSSDTLFHEGVQVHAGDVIGFQGDTGIGMNWKDNFNTMLNTVLPRNRQKLQPWDPPQLHYQVYQGRDQNAVKQNILDPFGLYAQITSQQGTGNPYSPAPGNLTPGAASLFLKDTRGNLQYAAP